jgi:hypothetical protein
VLKNPGRKVLLEIPRRRLENNIKIIFREKGWDDMDRIHFAQDTDQQWTVLNMAMNIRAP